MDDAQSTCWTMCYREGGALQRVEQDRSGGFRAFLYGVARNIARRAEANRASSREVQPPTQFGEAMAADDQDRYSRVFDRTWAKAMVRRAAARLAECALLIKERASGRNSDE
ncbi:MAG: hypothetical protein ACYTHJ_15700 [Planctomycetota bacterium]|jgi:hypothetical protein